MYKIENNFCYDGIIRIYFKGQVDIADIDKLCIELKSVVKTDKALILSDVREAKYRFGHRDIDMLHEMVKIHSMLKVKVFEALLIDTPAETAISTLFNMSNLRDEHFSRIFSTEKAALEWLLSHR